MASRFHLLCCLLCMILNTYVHAQSPDIGRIWIGNQGNRTDPTQYTFNNNNGGIQHSFGFSAVVFSGTDGSQIAKNDEILVTCENEFAGVAGFTQLTFTRVTLPAADSAGVISFRLTTLGRPAVVRCYGQSTNPAFACPATTDQSVAQPEFCRDTSLSDPITITLAQSPVVSICSVSTFYSTDLSATLNLQLSEAVRGSSVTVTCREEDPSNLNYCQQPGVTCCQRSHSVSLNFTVIDVGQTSATLTFQINTQNDVTCIGVVCQAESSAQLPEGYLQYVAGTSTDVTSEALLQTTTPTVSMQPQYLTVYNTTFQSLLYVDASRDVGFQCQASIAGTIGEALQSTTNIDCSFIFINATSTTTTTTAATPTINTTTTPLPSSAWLADTSFNVNSQRKYVSVRTSRELEVISPVQEIVVTTCCSTDTANTDLQRLRVTTVTVANLQPRLNFTGGVTTGEGVDERFVVNPAYREVAPCPCDLTYSACDINCCCDQECSDADKGTFGACIPGLAGGQSAGPDLRSCEADPFPKDDWFPLMCVEFESNAVLGHFYSKASKTTVTSFGDQPTGHIYTYNETEARFTDLAVVNGYTLGSSILTVFPDNSRTGNLLLPQPAPAGHCLDSTPVHFLQNSQSTCLRTLTQQTCADLTPFSARVFVEASSLYSPACPRSFRISKTGKSIQEDFVNVDVNYYCTTNLTDYVKTSTSFSDLVSSNTVYSFTSGLDNANCSDLCGADSSCLNYNQGLGQSGSTNLPPRCSFDDSFQLPSAPSYNQGLCSNVVLDVHYRFSWAGQNITGLTADVILGNVPLGSVPGSEASVSQKFAVSFVHDYTGASNQTDNFDSVTTPFQRSGRPGYDYGKAVATGCSSTDATSGVTSVDQSEVNRMAVWSPGLSGLCQDASRQFLTFGDDMQSSCALRLRFNDINNCDSLKRLVLNHLNVLMPANSIGRYGYNSPNINDMWIEILREEPLPNITDSTTTTPTPPITANTTETNTTVDPLSLRGGVCPNVVSGVHLEIMYAETGRNSRYPLREIIGAAVRYTVSNWTMSCVGAGSGRCQNNSVWTQSFLLHSSVQFTHVSPNTPHKPDLFYQLHSKENCDSDRCYRFFHDFDTSICHFDTCWHELFYPLTPGYQGYESMHYTRAFSLVMVVFILGYLSVAKPWK